MKYANSLKVAFLLALGLAASQVNAQATKAGDAGTVQTKAAIAGANLPGTAHADVANMPGSRQGRTFAEEDLTSFGTNRPEQWRYVFQNGRWWYWTPDDRWMWYDNSRWTYYEPTAGLSTHRTYSLEYTTNYGGSQSPPAANSYSYPATGYYPNYGGYYYPSAGRNWGGGTYSGDRWHP